MTDFPFPECTKLAEVREISQAQGDFLAWLQDERELTLGRWKGDELVPACVSIQDLLAEFHGIDMAKVEAERAEMLEKLRE